MSTIKVDDIQSRQSTDDAISLAADSSVSLKHSASAKLTTTATGVSITGACAATSVTATSVEDSKGDLRNIPQRAQASAITLVAADAGKHVVANNSANVTIPASVFSIGDAITIVNNSGSDITITCSAVTTYLANDTSTKSSLTLKARGIATFLFVSTTVVYGSGAGLE